MLNKHSHLLIRRKNNERNVTFLKEVMSIKVFILLAVPGILDKTNAK